MSEAKQANFESWAIVEILGHQRHIGFVTTQAYGSAVLFRCDSPQIDAHEFTVTEPTYLDYQWFPAGAKLQRPGRAAASVLIGPSTIYRITPCTEEAARQAIESLEARPLILLEMPAKTPAQLEEREAIRRAGGLISPDDEADDDPTAGLAAAHAETTQGGGI